MPKNRNVMLLVGFVIAFIFSLRFFGSQSQGMSEEWAPLLTAGQQTWQTQHIANYRIVLEESNWYGLGAEDGNGQAEYDLEVRNGYVIRSSCTSTYRKQDKCSWWNFRPRTYTVENLFARATEQTRGVFIDIQIDEIYGYPNLIASPVYDAWWQLEVVMFEPLPQS